MMRIVSNNREKTHFCGEGGEGCMQKRKKEAKPNSLSRELFGSMHHQAT